MKASPSPTAQESFENGLEPTIWRGWTGSAKISRGWWGVMVVVVVKGGVGVGDGWWWCVVVVVAVAPHNFVTFTGKTLNQISSCHMSVNTHQAPSILVNMSVNTRQLQKYPPKPAQGSSRAPSTFPSTK